MLNIHTCMCMTNHEIVKFKRLIFQITIIILHFIIQITIIILHQDFLKNNQESLQLINTMCFFKLILYINELAQSMRSNKHEKRMYCVELLQSIVEACDSNSSI